jgi:hypothetical protein
MPRAKLTVTGELRSGYFYDLYVPDRDGTVSALIADITEDAVVLRGDVPTAHLAYGSMCGWKKAKPRPICSRDAKHRTETPHTDLEFDITDGRVIGPVILGDDTFLLLRGDVAEKLRKMKPRGARIQPVSTVSSLFPNLPKGSIWNLYFAGRFPFTAREVVPAAANRCWNCGHSPIVCPECCWFKWDCPNCGKVCIDRNKGRSDDIPQQSILFDRSAPSFVVNGKRWDGSDFFGQNFTGGVTGRGLRMLKEAGAWPLVFQPLLVKVDGMSDEQLKKLEAVKYPEDRD